MNRDTLGDRMKSFESVSSTRLVPKMPVMMRLDGKAFHTLTRGFDKPLDMRFVRCMWATAKAVCDQVQGCRFAYTFSDEITLLLVDYDSRDQQGWFDYQVQKMCSVAASAATLAFAQAYQREWTDPLDGEWAYALFDARVWNLPAHEITNSLIWRQQDCIRSSISGLAQAHYSANALHGKDGRVMREMLRAKGVDWECSSAVQKYGACVVREQYEVERSATMGPPGHGVLEGTVTRSRWAVDESIPMFTADREYIEKHVRPREDKEERASE